MFSTFRPSLSDDPEVNKVIASFPQTKNPTYNKVGYCTPIKFKSSYELNSRPHTSYREMAKITNDHIPTSLFKEIKSLGQTVNLGMNDS